MDLDAATTARTRSLLRGNGAFRALWTARAVSYVGDSLGLVALILYTASSVGQAMAVALLLLVGDAAPSLLAPFAGALGDRGDLRRVMIASEALQGLMVLLVAVTLPGLALLLALVALRAVAGLVAGPAARAAVPALVDDHDLARANAGLGAGTNGFEAVGPLLAAALLPAIGVRGVLLADAATFALAALILAGLPPLAAVRAEGARCSLAADALAGLRVIWSVRLVRIVALGFAAIVLVNGVDDVALVFLARDDLGAGQAVTSLLYAGVGVGLLAGYALLARSAARVPLAGVLLLGFALNSAGNLLTGLAWAVAAALAMQGVRGLGIAGMAIAADTLLQRAVPEGMRGRVFANLAGAIGVAAGLSYVLGGLLLAATSARWTLGIAGAAGLVVTAAAAAALARR